MHFGKMYFITHCLSPTCFGRSHDHRQGVLGVKVSTLNTPCCNTNLVYVLIKRSKFKQG